MNYTPDIVALAHKQTVIEDKLELLSEKEERIPGSVMYHIRRYNKHPVWKMNDAGLLLYHFKKEADLENNLELRYCIQGRFTCGDYGIKCENCKNSAVENCGQAIDCVDVVSIRFTSFHLSQFVNAGIAPYGMIENILGFTYDASFSKTIGVCSRSRMVLETLVNCESKGMLDNIYVNAQAQLLLLFGLEGLLNDNKDVAGFDCKFLANDAAREKILQSREILLQHINAPITISQLSRRVGINQCYLKKGFKELFGTTILEFYQTQRMEHARFLLFEKGLSVTDVSIELGYSAISHFSTAFKRETGLKPCELLIGSKLPAGNS